MPETKLDRDIQEETIADASYQFEPMNASRIASQQNLLDTFYQEGIIPRPLDLQEVLLTPEQYVAITPDSLVSQL